MVTFIQENYPEQLPRLRARQEQRKAESLGMALMPVANHVLIGPLRKYRAVEASRVASLAQWPESCNVKGCPLTGPGFQERNCVSV